MFRNKDDFQLCFSFAGLHFAICRGGRARPLKQPVWRFSNLHRTATGTNAYFEFQPHWVGIWSQFCSDQVWSPSSFEFSCQLLRNDLNQVSSVTWLMTSSTALANEGLFELTLCWHGPSCCYLQELPRNKVVVSWKSENLTSRLEHTWFLRMTRRPVATKGTESA